MDDKATGQAEKALIRRVFLEHWDPIGVGGEPKAQDEYDSYLDEMYALLVRHAAEDEIVEYLRRIEIEEMGLSGDRHRLLPVAKILQNMNHSMRAEVAVFSNLESKIHGT